MCSNFKPSIFCEGLCKVQGWKYGEKSFQEGRSPHFKPVTPEKESKVEKSVHLAALNLNLLPQKKKVG
jgi:hypothetical protein